MGVVYPLKMRVYERLSEGPEMAVIRAGYLRNAPG